MTRSPLLVSAVVVAIAGAAAACSDSDRPEVKREPERPRRVIEPPSRGVRALPPHAIRADGVGPYKLGASAAELLDQLPSGPRIRQFTIPGIVQRDMLRGEDDAILIGTEPQGKAQFVAVVRGEIARTEAGIQVGSTREELERVLGTPVEDPERARDPRVVVPHKRDNAHVVFTTAVGAGTAPTDRVAAIVLVPAAPAAERASSKDVPPDGCPRPPSDRKRRLAGACLTPAGELVRSGADEIGILARDESKVLAMARIPGLVFAAPLRQAPEGRDDVVAIVHTEDDQARTWSLVVYRFVDGKLLRAVEPTPLYQLTAANARWIGADLRDLDLYVELAARPDAIEASGLLSTRVGSAIRDIVVISPVPVPRRRAKTPPPEAAGEAPADAGISDAPPAPSRPGR